MNLNESGGEGQPRAWRGSQPLLVVPLPVRDRALSPFKRNTMKKLIITTLLMIAPISSQAGLITATIAMIAASNANDAEKAAKNTDAKVEALTKEVDALRLAVNDLMSIFNVQKIKGMPTCSHKPVKPKRMILISREEHPNPHCEFGTPSIISRNRILESGGSKRWVIKLVFTCPPPPECEETL